MPNISTQNSKGGFRKELSSEFYVTEDCNGCGLCKQLAPLLFSTVEYTYSYSLTRQPLNDAEVDLLRNLALLCPVDALRELTKKK